uniref:alpha/beta hydrolase n=1 Tax=Eubacterium cellulosolvens TaxID=29322 RepID=UPI000552E9E9|nr:alpha/beta hydrolase [[Eubacterium] cellulosolvens]
MKKQRKKHLWLIPLVLLVALIGGFFVYTGDYYHASASAEAAMQSDQSVRVVRTEYGWLFDGDSTKDALIFYPGGKVETSAYAPLCRRIAERDMDVCLVDMPFRLAFFDMDSADKIIRTGDYERWYLAGHSLGGVAASYYAAENGDKLAGLILLASYPPKKLDKGLPTVLIHGSEDKVLKMDRYRENAGNLPPGATEYVIRGGNHARFGSYGDQDGDGKALITEEQQMQETVDQIERLKLWNR